MHGGRSGGKRRCFPLCAEVCRADLSETLVCNFGGRLTAALSLIRPPRQQRV